MPIDLAKVSQKQVKLVIDIDGEKLNLEYRPRVITPKLQVEMAEIVGPDLHHLLARMICSWDLESGGKPVKLSVDSLATVPLDILNACLTAIMADMRPNSNSPAVSAGSFS